MKRYVFPFRPRGFTLVELSISLAIIFLLFAIILWNYPETSRRLTLTNMTYTTSLLVREAQVRGSAIDSINSSVGGYGVYIDISSPRQLILFGDLITTGTEKPYGLEVGNGIYENGSQPGQVDEARTITTLSKGYSVSKLCVGTGFPFTCNSNNTPAINSLTVSFTRPFPLPSIYVNGSKIDSYSGACIELQSARAPQWGHVKSVQVFSSGIVRTEVGGCDNG